jgi:urease accessory protein
MRNTDVGQERLALLQLCDSLFPVGSFAHSDGLESAVAAGRVASAADLRDWLEATVGIVLADAEGPAVRSAYLAACSGDFAALASLDSEIDAMRPSSAGREATRAMGTRLLKTWQRIRPTEVVRSALEARGRFTFPVAFGLVCAASDVKLVEALEAYCYTRLAATVSAAMRLMPIGQHEAHGLLAEALRRVPACVDRITQDRELPRCFTPMMDIAAMSHQYVHSRLFRS